MRVALCEWTLLMCATDLDLLVFNAGGATRGARNIALPLLRHTPEPKGHNKTIAVGAALWTGSHGMRSVVNVRPPQKSDWHLGNLHTCLIAHARAGNQPERHEPMLNQSKNAPAHQCSCCNEPMQYCDGCLPDRTHGTPGARWRTLFGRQGCHQMPTTIW